MFYGTLDMLRGVAALFVVLFHARITFEMMAAWAPLDLGRHGYLAVDFFFQLSGFVVAAAYDARLRHRLGVAEFTVLRLKRLYPLIVLGLLLGWVAFSLPSPHQVHDPQRYFLRGLVLLPTYAFGRNAFPLNFPLWSIFFELLVNLGYAIGHRWLTDRRMAGLVAGCTVLTLALCAYKNSIDFGAGYPGLPGGVPRTAMSFFGGVLLFRHRHALPPWRMAPIAAAGLLAAMLIAPVPRAWAGVYDAAVVLIGFPCLIRLSSTADVGRGTRLAHALGAVSYPIYAVHAPLMLFCIVAAQRAGIAHDGVGFGLATFVVVVAGATVALKAWDEPIRQRLRSTRHRA